MADDGLLMIVNKQGMYTQGYVDDFVILISRKHLDTCLDVIQIALTTVDGWCKKEGFLVNPLKAVMVSFIKQDCGKVLSLYLYWMIG